jgi:hypothetical protein
MVKVENTKLFLFFFSFIEEKKNQKEKLPESPEDFADCGPRLRALP